MNISRLDIEGAWIAEFPIWKDDRGTFREWFNPADFIKSTGQHFPVEQANISSSNRGALRGIHYSLAKSGQAKWVTCVSGKIQDVVIDIRPKSPTFGKWVSIELSEDSGKAIYLSESLGHAFIALEDSTTVAYLVSSPYSPKEEHGINPLDNEINIKWKLPLSELLISEKDRNAPSLEESRIAGRLPINSLNK